MSSAPSTYYIGWDVGGWNCEKNAKSRDAIVILDHTLAIVGEPWRGNLRKHINDAITTDAWVAALFGLCKADGDSASAYLAIDTPLAFSEAFVRLVTGGESVAALEDSANNPYLYRQTERYVHERVFHRDKTPLSSVKDMIGSQATKGIHALAKYAPTILRCGVWTDGGRLTALEAYPAACKGSALIQGMRDGFEPVGHNDKEDALTCALIAYLYAEKPEALAAPGDDVPVKEGWIWVPKDVVV